jgi:hypothetical protein
VTTAQPQLAKTTAEQLVGRIPFWGKVQATVYSLGLIQWAVGIVTAAYILVTQANYFGRTNKPVWDGLNDYLHFRTVPGIGKWLYDNWDLARHLIFRNIQETVLAYAFVAMIIIAVKVNKKTQAGKIPLVHRIIVKLGMPSPYQGELGRHPDTSGLQYVFLVPSMFLCELPGLILSCGVVFGGMALGHRLGFHPAWFYPEATVGVPHLKLPWVQIVIGLVAGKFYGKLPAVKAGQDIQRRYLDARLAFRYRAGEILRAYSTNGKYSEEKALDELTAMPRTRPSELYPEAYRRWYDALLKIHAPARPRTRWTTIASRLTVALAVILGGYGVYAQRWGIPHHDLWIP